MPSRSVSIRTSYIVALLLIALTLITVGISFVKLDSKWHVLAGLSIGVIKAALVALFFMQAIVSPRLTWIVIVAAVFWMGILVSLTFTDYITRSMLPFAPGH